MNKRKTNDIGFSNFGFSTILLAFVMICIVTISAVSLLTANSDYKLSKKVAEKNKDYYIAEETAYSQLKAIDTELSLAYQEAENESEYYSYAETRLSPLGYGQFEKTDSGYIYSYSVPISDTQALEVILTVHYPTSDLDTFYKIACWKSAYETTIYEDETLNLFH